MRRFLALSVALVAASALAPAAPAQDAEAAGSVHPEAGDYVGHLTNGKTIHFKYANHRIEHLVAGPVHDPVFTAGGVEVHHGHFNFGNERKRLHGHWCDHNHMKGIYETHHSFYEFHAHRLHHGTEGHRCP